MKVARASPGERLDALLAGAAVIPVVTVEDAAAAAPLVETLCEAGLRVVEFTLRSAAALESIAQARKNVPGVTIGAGTVLLPSHMRAAHAAGADFAVSPGATDALAAAAAELEIPYLPGVGTVSEAMRLLARDFTCLKLFPAEACGGVGFLRAVAKVIPSARFCPTGGIGAANAADYLSCENVACVGGSWMVPTDALRRRDWATIHSLAREAAGLGAARS